MCHKNIAATITEEQLVTYSRETDYILVESVQVAAAVRSTVHFGPKGDSDRQINNIKQILLLLVFLCPTGQVNSI